MVLTSLLLMDHISIALTPAIKLSDAIASNYMNYYVTIVVGPLV